MKSMTPALNTGPTHWGGGIENIPQSRFQADEVPPLELDTDLEKESGEKSKANN